MLLPLLVLAPAQGDLYLALGMAYVRAGRMADAIDAFQRGTIYEPFSPALYTNLGAAYATRHEYGAARVALRRSLELSTFPLPRVHLTHTNLALVHLKDGRKGDGVKALKHALFVYPDYQYARQLLNAVTSRHAGSSLEAVEPAEFVFNDLLELFGETTTVAFDDE